MSAQNHVQPLEPRRLLSFAAVSAEAVVPFPHPGRNFDVAVAADGSYLVVGSGFANGTESISAVRYSASGQQISDVMPIDSFTGGGSGTVSLSAAADADGDAVVAFSTLRNNAYTVAVRRITRTGVMSDTVVVDSVLRPDSESEVFLGWPAVSMDAGGGFFLGWIESLSDSQHVVHMRAFDAAGADRADAFEAARISSPFSFVGSLDVDARPGGGGAAFAYFQDTSDSISQIVVVGRASTTARIGDLASVPGTSTQPDVAALPDGSFLLAYDAHPDFNDLSTASSRALVQRYGADGVAAGAPIELGAAIGSAAGTHDAAVDAMPDGGFVATFVRSTLNSGGQTTTNTLYASRYYAAAALDPSGAVALDTQTAGAVLPPSSTGAFDALDAIEPDIEADAAGRAVVAYGENEQAVFTRRLAASDEPVASVLEDGVLTVTGGFATESILVAVDGSNVRVTRGATVETFAAADVDAIVIDGGGGDDTIVNDTSIASTIRGGAGNDKLLGGSGNDSLAGGDGKDKLIGRAGNDSLAGNAGNDTLEGGLQADRLRGHGGRDRLFGNGGNDRLFGGAQGDWLYGQNGSDQLFGDGGADRLYDDYAAGVDTLHGGNGDDLLVSRDALADNLFGGRGDDISVDDTEEDEVAEVELHSIE